MYGNQVLVEEACESFERGAMSDYCPFPSNSPRSHVDTFLLVMQGSGLWAMGLWCILRTAHAHTYIVHTYTKLKMEWNSFWGKWAHFYVWHVMFYGLKYRIRNVILQLLFNTYNEWNGNVRNHHSDEWRKVHKWEMAWTRPEHTRAIYIVHQ